MAHLFRPKVSKPIDAMFIPREREAHWYRHHSDTDRIEPLWEVPRADGKGQRKTTLTDARKMKLMVGISTVANIMPKWGLQAWKIEQGILSALTLPREDNEPLDKFALRVVEDMDEKSRKARERGTEIHRAIEDHLSGAATIPDHLRPYLDGLWDWMQREVTDIRAAELTVGDPAIGAAGQLDLDAVLRKAGPTIFDFKTQRIEPHKLPIWYPEWPIQLAGYRRGREREMPGVEYNICSVIINSAEPGPVHVNLWLGGRKHYWELFQHCMALWKYTTNYDPAQL